MPDYNYSDPNSPNWYNKPSNFGGPGGSATGGGTTAAAPAPSAYRPPTGVPVIDPGIFTSGGSMKDQLGRILSTGTDYANYLTGEETRRYNESNATLASGRAAFNKPSMNEQDIARMFSGASDKAAAGFNEGMGALRNRMGATGRTGGGFDAGLAARYRAQRSASLTDATRSLYEKQIDVDMQDRRERWMADQAVAQGQGRDPSIVGLDWLGQAGTATLGMAGIEAQSEAARQAAQAQKKASKMSGIGGVVQAGMGALIP